MVARDSQVAGAVWDFRSLTVHILWTSSGEYKTAVLILGGIDL